MSDTPVCKYCGDVIKPYAVRCERCERDCTCKSAVLVDACLCCHAELAHDVIKNQNIHIAGQCVALKINTPDYDPDAYGYVQYS